MNYFESSFTSAVDSGDLAGVDLPDVPRLQKSQRGSEGVSRKPTGEPRGFDFDPLDHVHNLNEDEFWGGPHSPHPSRSWNALTYDELRIMASEVPLVSGVITARNLQVQMYTEVYREGRSVGFSIRLKDPKARSTRETRKRAAEIADMVVSCGRAEEFTGQIETFSKFTQAFIWDSLVFDAGCAELVRTRRGKPVAWLARDPSTIRLSTISNEERLVGRRDPRRAGYVQIVNGKTVAAWRPADFLYMVRNHRTDGRLRGYGVPELQEIVSTVTNLVNARTYNAANFRNGAHSSGLVAVTTDMSAKLWKATARRWRAMLHGVNNAAKVGLLRLSPQEKEAIQHIDLSKSNKDMEFSEWLRELMREVCLKYAMDPAEVGFHFGQEGVSSSLSSSGPSDRIAASKERGLYPLLRTYADHINARIVSAIDPRFELVFEGLDAKDENAQLERRTKAVGSHVGVNEVRAEEDRKAFTLIIPGTENEDGSGGINFFDLPANPTLQNNLVNIASQIAGRRQQAAQAKEQERKAQEQAKQEQDETQGAPESKQPLSPPPTREEKEAEDVDLGGLIQQAFGGGDGE